MLDIKKLLTKITDLLRVTETETFTALTKTWTFRRIGNIVFMDAPADSRNVVAGYNAIGTLSASMRPTIQQRIAIGNASNVAAFLEISTNGVVQFYSAQASSGARNCSLSTSFIRGGVLRKSIYVNYRTPYRKVVAVC